MTELSSERSGNRAYSLAEFSQALARAIKSLEAEPVEKLRADLIEVLQKLDKSKNIPDSFKKLLLEKFGITDADYQQSPTTQDRAETDEVAQVSSQVTQESASDQLAERILAADTLVKKWIQNSMTLPSTREELAQ